MRAQAVNQENAAILPIMLATKVLPEMEVEQAALLEKYTEPNAGVPLGLQYQELSVRTLLVALSFQFVSCFSSYSNYAGKDALLEKYDEPNVGVPLGPPVPGALGSNPAARIATLTRPFLLFSTSPGAQQQGHAFLSYCSGHLPQGSAWTLVRVISSCPLWGIPF
jgi:hypothetical protein